MDGCWLDTLPLTGAYTTYALDEKNPALIDYVTDSAASGTGWSTGHKTSNGRIASVAGTGATVTKYTTILELAQAAGLKTGNVTTAELTDATPAVLNAHINDRGCQGPGNMATCLPSKKENGGPGSIAEQTVDHHVNVFLGRSRSLHAAGDGRSARRQVRHRVGAAPGLSVTSTMPQLSSSRRASWFSGSSTTRTCHSSGPGCRHRHRRERVFLTDSRASRISVRPTSRRSRK